VSVSKLRALAIQFLLVLLLGLAAAPFLPAATTALAKPGAPLDKPSAPIARNLKVNGPNPLDPTQDRIGTSRDT
jgi:hypothetical protein